MRIPNSNIAQDGAPLQSMANVAEIAPENFPHDTVALRNLSCTSKLIVCFGSTLTIAAVTSVNRLIAGFELLNMGRALLLSERRRVLAIFLGIGHRF